MRITTLGISIDSSTLLNGYFNTNIDEKVFNAINIVSIHERLNRGVLVHNKFTKIVKSKSYLIQLYKRFKIVFSKFKNAFEIFMLDLLGFTYTLDQKSLLPKNKSYISLEPENQFYGGYIICFENYLAHCRDSVFEVYSNDDEVIITNQTNYSFDRYDNRPQTGTLVVIHSSEEIPIELEFYTYTNIPKEGASFLSCFKATIKPKQYNSIHPELEFNYGYGSKTDINIDHNFFEHLYKECDGSIKGVYEMLSNSEVEKLYFENFIEESKLKLVNEQLAYTKDSII